MLRWSKNVNCNEKLFNYLNIDKPELESLVLRGRESIGCVVKNAGPVVEDVTLYVRGVNIKQTKILEQIYLESKSIRSSSQSAGFKASNSVQDVWFILRFVRRPRLLGSITDSDTKYCR